VQFVRRARGAKRHWHARNFVGHPRARPRLGGSRSRTSAKKGTSSAHVERALRGEPAFAAEIAILGALGSRPEISYYELIAFGDIWGRAFMVPQASAGT